MNGVQTHKNLVVVGTDCTGSYLDLIENVWLLLKNKIIGSLNRIRNLDDLKTELLNAWNNVPLHYLHNLYGSMSRRIRQALVQKGHIAKY